MGTKIRGEQILDETISSQQIENETIQEEDIKDGTIKLKDLNDEVINSMGGEINTASNIGLYGVGLYNGKVGVDLQFKNINVGSNKLSIINNPTNKTADLDVIEGNLTLGNIGGTLPITKGGTGQTSANSALNALLPTQTSNSNKFLKTDGTNTSWSLVSNTDVGLGNVTNDAQIAKSIGTTKGDLIVFPSSANPTRLPVGTNGQVLMSDSTVTNGVKWGNVSTVFGSEQNYAESLTESSTTSSTLQTKLTLSYTPSVTGIYRLGFYCEIRDSSPNKAIQVVLYYNTTSVCNTIDYNSKLNQIRSISGFGNVSLTGGTTYTLTIKWCQYSGTGTAYIRNAKIEAWRVS